VCCGVQRDVASEHWATIVVFVDGAPAASWELSGCGEPTLTTVDALARLHLDAGRLGWNLVVDDPVPALADLLRLAGLAAVFAA
jgi:hypothetical protein